MAVLTYFYQKVYFGRISRRRIRLIPETCQVISFLNFLSIFHICCSRGKEAKKGVSCHDAAQQEECLTTTLGQQQDRVVVIAYKMFKVVGDLVHHQAGLFLETIWLVFQ